jgi:hypothetical protein
LASGSSSGHLGGAGAGSEAGAALAFGFAGTACGFAGGSAANAGAPLSAAPAAIDSATQAPNSLFGRAIQGLDLDTKLGDAESIWILSNPAPAVQPD